jgi:hypothetical protein
MSKKTEKSNISPHTDAKALAKSRLDQLIEGAIVDCYGESEQISGFFNMLEERLAVPFTTDMLGVEIVVERIDITDEEEIVAICRRGRGRQRISSCRNGRFLNVDTRAAKIETNRLNMVPDSISMKPQAQRFESLRSFWYGQPVRFGFFSIKAYAVS